MANHLQPESRVLPLPRPATILGRVLLLNLAAAMALLVGCDGPTGPSGLSEKSVADAHMQMEMSGGNQQVGLVDSELGEPLAIKIRQKSGKAFADQNVTWRVIEGRGSLSAVDARTDANGVARAVLTLGPEPGQNLVAVKNPRGDSLVFRARAEEPRVETLLLSQEAMSIVLGETTTLGWFARNQLGQPMSCSVTWQSSDPSVVAVDASGNLSAVGLGQATVTVTAAGGVSTEAEIAVTRRPAASVAASMPEVFFTALDQDEQLTAEAFDAEGVAIEGALLSWRSMDTTTARVSADGRVTAVGRGFTWVLVTAQAVADTVAVDIRQEVASIEVTPGSLELEEGETLRMTTHATDATGHAVRWPRLNWSSSDESVATVDRAGRVRARSPGSAAISAAAGDARASITVNVGAPPPARVSDLRVLGRTETTVTLGWTEVDDGVGAPAEYTVQYDSPTLQWGSSGSTTTTLAGRQIGETLTLTVADLTPETTYQFQLLASRTDAGGTHASDRSNVAEAITRSSAPEPTVATLVASPSDMAFSAVGQVQTISVTARDSDGAALDPELNWESSRPDVASVDGSGRVVARGVGTALIVVSAVCCTAEDTVTVTVTEAPIVPLAISGIAPSDGPVTGGVPVTISGNGFEAGATVSIGGVEAIDAAVASSTSIVLTTPEGFLGSADVRVTNPDGSSVELTGGFTYLSAPTLESLSPTEGSASGGTTVTLTGSGFERGSTVHFGDTEATSVFVASSTSITATAPANATGSVAVAVTNPDGGTASLPDAFTYVPASPTSPTLISVTEAQGPTTGGTVVTLTGTLFEPGATVHFGSAAATGVTVTSSTSITAITPAYAAGSVTVTVTNPDGSTASLPNGFTFTSPLAISGITPAVVATTGGETVTIRGSAFIAGATVVIGGVAATGVYVASPTSISAVVPAHAAGAVDVVVTNPDGQVATLVDGLTYQYSAPDPDTGSVHFTDGFESGDLSSQMNGFRWGAAGDGSLGSNVAVSSTYARSDSMSLAFTYHAKPDGKDATAEQRFFLAPEPTEAPDEVWIEYYVRVPENYRHRSQSGTTENNKVLLLWAETYTRGSFTEAYFVAQTQRRGDQRSSIEFNAFNGKGQHRGVSQAMTEKGDVFVASDGGKWIQIRFHIRIGDLSGTNAIAKMWKDGTLIGALPDSFVAAEGNGRDYFRKGYLFGWSNSGFDEKTVFYLDDFTVHTSDPGW